ncbi:hypothetical protein BDV12DRAFT_198564 [Aspergillus spectabilis]
MSRASTDHRIDGKTSEYELLPRAASPPSAVESGSVHSAGQISQILDTWFYEVLVMLFSLACFIGIIYILMCMMSSLILAIGECIGQLKWLRFYKAQKKKKKKKKKKKRLDGIHTGVYHGVSWRLHYSPSRFEPFMQQIPTYLMRRNQFSSAAAKKAFTLILPLLG